VLDPQLTLRFANAERLSATRVSLIQSARERENKNVIGDLLSNQSEGLVKLEIASQLRLSELARKEGDLQAAVNAVTAVRQLELPDQVSDEAQDEFSQVLWAQGHHSLAIRHITNIAKGLQDGRRRALLLGRSAHWTALAKLAAAQDIQHTFRNSRDMGSNHGLEPRERAQLAHEFASWADSYYTTLSKSPVLERLRKKDEIRNGGSRAGSPVVELEEERKHKEALEQGLLDYLIHALDNYAEALSLCDDYDDSITRLCSLWLAHDTDEQANKKFEKRLKRIGTHKFIVLAPQLAARLFRPKQRTAFNDLLNNLMLRLGQEHPYHVLYQIITLAAAAPPLSASSRSKPASSSSSDSRSAAASEILEYLRSDKAHPLASEASVKMREFAAASVNWAQYCHDHKDGTKVGADIQVPQTCDLRYRCHDVPIPIATVIPAIDLSGEYRNLPTIQRYRSVYRVAGGIHRPAIMTVVDTLGSYHVQLVSLSFGAIELTDSSRPRTRSARML
jgi:ataxia telangiectasia mutated family protein